jgi:hypothetical protein
MVKEKLKEKAKVILQQSQTTWESAPNFPQT